MGKGLCQLEAPGHRRPCRWSRRTAGARPGAASAGGPHRRSAHGARPRGSWLGTHGPQVFGAQRCAFLDFQKRKKRTSVVGYDVHLQTNAVPADTPFSTSLRRKEASEATSRASTRATVLGRPHRGWEDVSVRSWDRKEGRRSEEIGRAPGSPRKEGVGQGGVTVSPAPDAGANRERAASRRPRWLAGSLLPRPPGGAGGPERVCAEGPWAGRCRGRP